MGEASVSDHGDPPPITIDPVVDAGLLLKVGPL
jgi:hypothetical protein